MVVIGLLLTRAFSVVPMNEADLNQQEKDTPNSCDTMWVGSGSNLSGRVEGPLSGPTTDTIPLPPYGQEVHRVLLGEEILGSVGLK